MKSIFWIALALVALVLVGIPIFLQRQADANYLSDANWRFVKTDQARGEMEAFRPDGLDEPKAYRFILGSFSDAPDAIVFENPVGSLSGKPGEQWTLRFWGRSASSSSLVLRIQGEDRKDPIAWQRFRTLEPQWHRYRYTFPLKSIGDGPKVFRMLLGGEAGAIDLCDIRLQRGERIDLMVTEKKTPAR